MPIYNVGSARAATPGQRARGPRRSLAYFVVGEIWPRDRSPSQLDRSTAEIGHGKRRRIDIRRERDLPGDLMRGERCPLGHRAVGHLVADPHVVDRAGRDRLDVHEPARRLKPGFGPWRRLGLHGRDQDRPVGIAAAVESSGRMVGVRLDAQPYVRVIRDGVSDHIRLRARPCGGAVGGAVAGRGAAILHAQAGDLRQRAACDSRRLRELLQRRVVQRDRDSRRARAVGILLHRVIVAARRSDYGRGQWNVRLRADEGRRRPAVGRVDRGRVIDHLQRRAQVSARRDFRDQKLDRLRAVKTEHHEVAGGGRRRRGSDRRCKHERVG